MGIANAWLFFLTAASFNVDYPISPLQNDLNGLIEAVKGQ